MTKRFPLETVRRVRALREKQRQREFAEKKRALDEVQMRIDGAERQKAELLAQLNFERRHAFDRREDLLNLRLLNEIERRRGFLRAERESARKDMEKRRAVMMRAMTERKALDNLRERFRRAQAVEEARKDTERLSEAAIQRYGRMRDEGEGL
ncbi:MAG: hypothetical protein M5R36_13440 [Deltaproteobacteria bacterium]|nr:hypothetical protein [Deltaproteobacteria bacterium]